MRRRKFCRRRRGGVRLVFNGRRPIVVVTMPHSSGGLNGRDAFIGRLRGLTLLPRSSHGHLPVGVGAACFGGVEALAGDYVGPFVDYLFDGVGCGPFKESDSVGVAGRFDPLASFYDSRVGVWTWQARYPVRHVQVAWAHLGVSDARYGKHLLDGLDSAG